MTEPQLHVFDDPAYRVGNVLAAAATGCETIVLTGGASIGAAYEAAAEIEWEWSGASVWWSDERCVPPDDERSNYRLAKETLLDALEKPPASMHRIRGEAPPAEAAAELDAALAGVTLDLLLLGLGPDGHMASLFPGSPQLEVTDRRATDGPAGLEPWVHRVTFTVPTIQSAERVVFLVSGSGKAEAVERAFGGDISADVPASLSRRAARVEIFLDPAAGDKLDGR